MYTHVHVHICVDDSHWYVDNKLRFAHAALPTAVPLILLLLLLLLSLLLVVVVVVVVLLLL